MKYNLKYNDLFEFTENEDILTIKGKAWKGLKVPNKKVMLSSEKEIGNIEKTLKNAPLQCDHSKSVKDTVGKVIESRKDGESVFYGAQVHDREIAGKVKKGLITQCSLSLGADAFDEVEFEGEKWISLTGCRVVELSLVLHGAVEGNSVFPQFEFSIVEEESNPEHEDIDPILEYKEIETKKVELELLKELMQIRENLKLENENLKKRLYFSEYAQRFEWNDRYYKYSLEELVDLIDCAHELSVYKYVPKGSVTDEELDFDPKIEMKENIRELIFNKRRDNKPLKNLHKETDIDKSERL